MKPPTEKVLNYWCKMKPSTEKVLNNWLNHISNRFRHRAQRLVTVAVI